MCAAWINNNVEDAAGEQQWARRLARYARPAFNYALEIVMAPVHLAQRMFYRPNTIQDEFIVEDLAAKCKSEITQTYIQCYTQKTHSRPPEAKYDPRKTYDNLDSCHSGTFKTMGMLTQPDEPVPDLVLIDEIPEPAPEPANNVVFLHSPSLSDSQIMRARPALSDSQVMRARPALSDSQVMRARPGLSDSQIMSARRSLLVRPLVGQLAGDDFTGTDSGTYSTMPNLAQIKANVASGSQICFTQSGVYQLIEPDVNPNGLQQFIEEIKEEKSA
jgi:hypothetical protein